MRFELNTTEGQMYSNDTMDIFLIVVNLTSINRGKATVNIGISDRRLIDELHFVLLK